MSSDGFILGKKAFENYIVHVLQSLTVQPTLSNAASDQANEVDILIQSREVPQRKPASERM